MSFFQNLFKYASTPPDRYTETPQSKPVTQIQKTPRGYVSPLGEAVQPKTNLLQKISSFTRFKNGKPKTSSKIIIKANPSNESTPSATPVPIASALPKRIKIKTNNQPVNNNYVGQAPQNIPNQQFIEEKVLPITRKYNIPDAIAAGQFAAEGRLQGMGASRNNFFNIAAFDQNPYGANYYPTPEAGVEAYAQLIAERYAQALQEQDVINALRTIQALGYAGDPNTYQQRADNGYASYADFIMNTPEFKYYYNQ